MSVRISTTVLKLNIKADSKLKVDPPGTGLGRPRENTPVELMNACALTSSKHQYTS